MSQNNTDIQVKRSEATLAQLASQNLEFGEPLFVDNTTHDSEGKLTGAVKAYMVVGRKLQKKSDPINDPHLIDVERSPVFKAFSADRVGNFVFYDPDTGALINEEGDQIPANRLTVIEKKISDLTEEDAGNYHILCQKEGDTQLYKFTDDRGIFINGRGIMQGAAWNDYAEYRPFEGETPQPGQIVCDTGHGTVQLSTRKLQPCAHIISDTYGYIIGDSTNAVPIALAGRTLVCLDQLSLLNLQLGDCICAGSNGFASKMTRQEITNFPEAIIGIVCEIPEGAQHKPAGLDNRVWVNVK